MTGICEGLNVLEMGSGSIAVSIAGMVLADAGARVVKIEPPEGDWLRTGNPSGFLVWNRGKESRVADLRTSAGQGDLRALAANADVVIDAFGPGVTCRWGVGAAALREANPRLVHCAITGFGTQGPYAGLKGYDSIVAAKLGHWSRGDFSYRDGPVMRPVPWPSFGAAMQAIAGIMAGLVVREDTGRGQAVDVTLASGLEPVDYFMAIVHQLAARRPAASAGSPQVISRYGVLLATQDGRLIQTSAMQPRQGMALCKAGGIDHLMSDPRFARMPMFDTLEDAQAWEDLLLGAFLEKPLSHWLPRLEANPDVAFEVARTSEQGLDHPQIVHNGDAITIEDPQVGPVRQVGPIGHFGQTPMTPTASAPALGAHGGDFEPRAVPGDGRAAPAHPLAGVTILELGNFYAMPAGVALLAELGARVIKVEDRNGDPHRASFGHEVASTKTTAGKESISLDLRTPQGQKIAQALASRANVFVTNFRAGVPDKLGLGYETLKALNPGLLYVHAAGYGVDGPYAHRILYAQAAQAVAGSFGRQVGAWSSPERIAGWSAVELQAVVFPRLHQVIDGDSNAALAVQAVAALGVYHQKRTGQGQRVNTSMIAGNAWAYADDFCAYDSKPGAKLCDEEDFGTSALDRLYPCADKTWLCLHVRTQAEFEALATALDRPNLATEQRFADAGARAAHDDELITAIGEAVAVRPALEWEAVLTAADVGAAAVSMEGLPTFVGRDPGLRQSGLTVTYEHPLFGQMVRWAPHVGFSDGEGRVAPPCQRGQHNRALLSELGYGDAEIAELEAAGVLFPPASAA